MNERGLNMADIRSDGSELLHYDNPDYPVYFRKNEISKDLIFHDISIHWHDELELIYIKSGSIRYQLNGKTVRMKAGEGIFVNSKQLHLIVSDGADCELYCLIFHPMILCAAHHIAEKYVAPVMENGYVPYLMLSETEPWQCRILENIAAVEKDLEADAGELLVMGRLFEICRQLYLHIKRPVQGERVQDRNLILIKEMIAYIQKHYQQKLTLQEICDAGKVGKTKGTAVFGQYLNQTPIEYVCNYRIERSIELLRSSDANITEIAYETGFSEGGYYSKVFKERMGVSPLQYRRLLKKEAREGENGNGELV